jgi:hypothetical protein
MNLNTIKEHLAKPATQFTVGGFRPTNKIDESWIARVSLYKESEVLPLDRNGKSMFPLAQFYIPSFPYIPTAVKETQVLTVFMPEELPDVFDPISANWLIREYESINDLVVKDIKNPESELKAFPLRPEFLEKDYPLWDTQDIPSDVEKAILKLEDEGEIESYYDIIEHSYTHKFGGYPSFCQSGIDFGDGFEFVFQISSDEKIGLNVVDSGSFLFAKNIKTNEWKLYFDFY